MITNTEFRSLHRGRTGILFEVTGQPLVQRDTVPLRSILTGEAGRQINQPNRLAPPGDSPRTSNLDDALEFANVAGPGVLSEDARELGLEPNGWAAARSQLPRKHPSQHRDVVESLPEWWDLDYRCRDPVVEVGAEFVLIDQAPQIRVGRRNDPDVYVYRFAAPGLDGLAFLEHAQKPGLMTQRQFCDLVQEDRTAVCSFEAALALKASSRKGSAPSTPSTSAPTR